MPYDCVIMKLNEAMTLPDAPRLSEVARHLGVRPPTVAQWRSGARPVPTRHCIALTRLFPKVTLPDLRPDDAHLIWPELAAQPIQSASEVANV